MLNGVKIEVGQVFRMEGEGKTRAFADVVIGDVLLVKGLRIVSGKKGLFVSMPRRQGKDGTWYETVRPLTREVREELSEIVLTAYGT